MANNRATNPFFNNFRSSNEQNLAQDLVDEFIAIGGYDFYYLPRTYSNHEDINMLGGDASSEFNDAYSIPLFLEEPEYGGSGDFLSKFGLEIDDQFTLRVSRRIFESKVPNQSKPMTGDLLFFQMGGQGLGTFFEISFVEDEKPFYQLGKNYTYTLNTRLFTYSSERFNTGIPGIDEIQKNNAYGVDITLDDGIGDYIVGEILTNSTTTAKVFDWDKITKIIRVGDLTANIISSANIVGNTSGTEYSISTFDRLDLPTNDEALNDYFEREADEIIETDETNPFGNF